MTLTSFWFSVFTCSKKHLVNCCFGARCFGIRTDSSPHERDCTFLGDIEKHLSFKSRNPKATVLHGLHGWILWPQDCLFSSSKRKCGSQRLWHCGKFHLTFPIRSLYTIVWMFSSVFLVHGRVCDNTVYCPWSWSVSCFIYIIIMITNWEHSIVIASQMFEEQCKHCLTFNLYSENWRSLQDEDWFEHTNLENLLSHDPQGFGGLKFGRYQAFYVCYSWNEQ